MSHLFRGLRGPGEVFAEEVEYGVGPIVYGRVRTVADARAELAATYRALATYRSLGSAMRYPLTLQRIRALETKAARLEAEVASAPVEAILVDEVAVSLDQIIHEHEANVAASRAAASRAAASIVAASRAVSLDGMVADYEAAEGDEYDFHSPINADDDQDDFHSPINDGGGHHKSRRFKPKSRKFKPKSRKFKPKSRKFKL